MRVIFLFFFSVNLSFNLKAQTLSIGSKDTLANKNNFYSNQYMSPLYAKNTNFFYGDLIKKKNEYAAVHTYLVKDLNRDGYSDLFLSFFTGGEIERVPFKLFLYDTLKGKMIERTELIKNNIGQTFNRKSMAADLNGDEIPDIICVSHPECSNCEFSSFDILFSESISKTWTQKTIKISSRNKGEGYYHGVAVGDVDNDGDNDIVLANENTNTEGTRTLINNGKGDFIEINSMNFFEPCCFKSGLSWTNELADMNKDGFLDLLYWHDSTYRGIAYGDGSGNFGRVSEQRFPKSRFTLTMDYDPVDLDNDNDLDLILTTTDYNNGWELVFLENKGLDQNKKIIWLDRSKEVNDILRSKEFYNTQETENWVPYIHVSDLNKDGFMDIFPQKPLSNGENPWILYGTSSWSFSYLPLNILEIPTKPKFKKIDHETTQISWPKYTILHPRSGRRVKGWNIYYANKYFGDKSMIRNKPVYVSMENYILGKDSVVFELKFPFPKTYIRITSIDSSGLETPFSEIDSVDCASPPKPTISWNGNELSTASTYSGYQWLFNDSNITGASATQYKPVNPGNYKVRVSNANQCTETSGAFMIVVTALSNSLFEGETIKVFPNPTSSNCTIDLGQQPQKTVSIRLFSLTGVEIGRWSSKQRVTKIGLDNLPNGKYILEISSSKNKTTASIIKN